MHDPANNSVLPDPTHPPAWLLTPSDLDAIHADPSLLDRLAAGEPIDENGPAARLLTAWLLEVGGAR